MTNTKSLETKRFYQKFKIHERKISLVKIVSNYTILGIKCDFSFKRTMKSSLVSSSQPRSVALGDVNNDHHIDFVVANSGTNTIGVFIAQGNGTFAKQQTYPTGSESYPRSLAINDFNNDSYADIVVANYDTNSIGLFLGYGNSTFDNQKFIPLGSSHPLFVTTGDFNKDNRIDIVVVNNGTNTIGILLGNGNGSFQHPLTYFTGYDSFPSALATGDFNNDTHLDIVVANSGTNNIAVLLNYGNGTFTNQQIYTTTLNSNPSSIAVGDFNNDNRLDIVVAHYGTGNIGIFFGDGDGSFLSQVSYTIGTNTSAQYVTVNDMDKDNALDVVITDPQNARVYVVPGYGNGSFATIAIYDGVSGSIPVSISVDDFNNNNQSDIVVVNHGTNNVVVLMDYFVKPSATEMDYYVPKAGGVGTLAVNDFNNDSIPDIVFKALGGIGVFMGLGNSTFDEQRTYLTSEKSRPQYICTGDVNNDNQVDIIIADIVLDGVDIFLGYGNGSFGTVTTYSTGIGSFPVWVALDDFNNDNVLDIVSANYGTNSIGILLGNGNGSFALTRNYSLSRPLSVAVNYINNDNHLDIVVSTGLGRVVIYLGQGNSTFIFIAEYVTGSGYTSWMISLGDFNRDNYLDIVVANIVMDNIGVLLGYGNGTFALQTKYLTGLSSLPCYVIVADCNNDNISDFVATLEGSDEVVIFYGYGNGSFELKRSYSIRTGSKPFGIVTADLDNDTHLEFVVGLRGTDYLAILTEYYAAEFVDKIVYSTDSAPKPTSVAIADFNNDNRSDIVVANSGIDTLVILLATNNGTFSTGMTYPIGTDSYPQYVITCDINKDNHIDIVSVNTKDNSISVIIGYGNGNFAEQMTYLTGNKSYPYAVVAGDVNNDNRLDLVIANSGTNSIGIFYGYNYTSFQPRQTLKSIDNLSPMGITVSDFNNDNILDLAATFRDSDSWCIFLGHGNGSFSIATTYSLSNDSNPYGISVGDFNNDNQSDIVITNTGSNNIGVYLGYGDGSFSTIRLYSTGNNSYPIAVAFGDVNNDSRLDIVVANYKSDNIGVFLGYGNGSFATMMAYSTGKGSSPFFVTVADFNNDGRLDIAVANYYTSNVGILLGYGNGKFANQVIFLLGPDDGPMWLTVGDFNGDNQLDIATANYQRSTVSILRGHGNGSFASVRTYSAGAGSLPSCISIGDFNNDNKSDIAVVNYGLNSVVVLFGLGDGSFLLGSVYSTGTGSSPVALVNGDFNKDGRLDIAVANYKLSTIGVFLGHKSQPFAGVEEHFVNPRTEPHSVALGDFNNDSWLDIVVANYGSDSIGILLGRNGRDFKDIQSYSTGNDSAPYSVALAHFNNDTYLDIVVANSETDNIIIFLGDGTGNFPINKTYSTGIRSRPYQVSIGDFNNDNISDIAVANSGTNNILLLYGYKNGTFTNETYLFGYEYQPYSLAVGDLNEDDWIDIAIACYGTDNVETLIKMC